MSVEHPVVDGIDAVDNGRRDSARIALTFDADMTPDMLTQLQRGRVSSWYNAEVPRILIEEGVPATLFLTGLWTATYPEAARSLARNPLFEIGNHTYDHAAFRTPCYGMPGAADRRAELARAQEQIRSTTGITPRLLRFPGDCYADEDVALAHSFGLLVVSGDVRGGDGFNPSATSVAARVLGGLRPGSIVILHMHGGPNAPMTAPALRLIIKAARERGFGFSTVSDLIGHSERPPQPAAPEEILSGLRSAPLASPYYSEVLSRVRSRPLRFAGLRRLYRQLPGLLLT